MKTLEFLKERSQEKDFPLQVCAAGLIAALGGPLVVVPVVGIVAADALVTAITRGPRALQHTMSAPARWFDGLQKAAALQAQERRLHAERDAEASRVAEASAKSASRSELAVIDARFEVIRFHETNRLFLEEALPASLFRSQLQTRFPSTLSGEQAWLTAREMITEMLPMVAAGRERRAAIEAERRKQTEEQAAAEKTQRDLENSRHAVGRLTQWYEREKARIVELMPECLERDVILQQLYERFDQLVKESIREMKP